MVAVIRSVLASRWFFIALVAVFILETTWVIVSLAYPGIFDESWHYQIIQQYAKQWSPILTSQGSDTYNLGALTHNPSFVFYYVMSLFYRMVSLLTTNDTARILFLRFVDLTFFALGLGIFRKAFIESGVTRAAVHVGLLFFILVPVVPFLAAQINYDNLVMIWSALTFLMLVRAEKLRRKKTLPEANLAWLMIFAALGAMTQYVFLPVLAATILYSLWVFVTAGREQVQMPPVGSWRRALLIFAGAVTLGLGVASYGMNIVTFHTPVPDCNDILTTDQCLSYYTFDRNYMDHTQNLAVDPNPLKFTAGWLYRIYTTSFYTALNGSPAPLQVVPLPLPALAAAIIALFGAVMFLYHFHWIAKKYPTLVLSVAVALFFIVVFWFYSYDSFLYYKDKIGINGRYLFPVELPLIIAVGIAIGRTFRQHQRLLASGLVICFLLFLQGGGATTYVISSNVAWWWPNQHVITLATTMRQVIQPSIINFKLFW